jgi:hypothetical protein
MPGWSPATTSPSQAGIDTLVLGCTNTRCSGVVSECSDPRVNLADH